MPKSKSSIKSMGSNKKSSYKQKRKSDMKLVLGNLVNPDFYEKMVEFLNLDKVLEEDKAFEEVLMDSVRRGEIDFKDTWQGVTEKLMKKVKQRKFIYIRPEVESEVGEEIGFDYTMKDADLGDIRDPKDIERRIRKYVKRKYQISDLTDTEIDFLRERILYIDTGRHDAYYEELVSETERKLEEEGIILPKTETNWSFESYNFGSSENFDQLLEYFSISKKPERIQINGEFRYKWVGVGDFRIEIYTESNPFRRKSRGFAGRVGITGSKYFTDEVVKAFWVLNKGERVEHPLQRKDI